MRGDKAHPHSAGYLCQKAQRLTWLGDHPDRLTTPLRRRPDGSHEPVSWEVALGEIAARLRTLRDADDAAGRPSSFAYYGGGGQGNHSGGAYGASLMKWMRSGRYFNALSQEKTGDFWVNGRMFGSQVVHTAEGMEEADLLIVLGCNPWMAHGFRNARNIVNEFKNDAARKMIVIDPRRTETADAADLHLPVRPGTDAFLLSAILRLLIERGGVDPAFIEAHTDGFEEVASVLMRVPVDEWIAHAEVERADVDRAVELILAASAMTVRVELGIQQGRHSTLNSYLEKLLYLLTGHFGRPGTNAVHSWIQPLWSNSRGARSPVTGIEQIGGLYPTNTLAEEILTDHPHRIRALWVESSNPANTAAETTRVEEAIRACELSVVVDIAYTETAQLADYILPAASQHEKWEYTLFNFEFPTNYFHLRRPLFEPLGDALPESEIYARLFEALGVLPGADVLAGLAEVAAHDRPHLLEAAMKVIGDRPELGDLVPVLLYRTLGPSMPHGAAHAAPVWLFCHRAAGTMPEQVRRALGSTADGNALGEELFHAVLDNQSGVAFSTHHHDEVWSLLRTERIQLAVPELLEWIAALDPDTERADPDYPFSLLAGQRRSYNANQIMRAPGWRKADHDGALWVHPDDLAELGLADGEWVAVATPTGRVTVRAEANDSMRRRQIALPHGFGMSYPDEGGRVTSGPRLNLLTTASDRDPIAATPHHKDVAARLERATAAEAEAADATSQRVRVLVGSP